MTKEQAVKVAEKLGLGNVSELISQTLLNMYDLFVKKDALLIEINPYAEDAFDTSKCKHNRSYTSFLLDVLLKHALLLRKFIDFALDAKLRFDDTAEYRQKDLFKLRDYTQEDQKEVAATKFDLNYIALDGAIGKTPNNYF